MVELFRDLPEALSHSVEIARRCAFRPRTHQPILPRFSTGDNGKALDEASELRKRAEEGLERRLETAGVAPGHTVDEYRERLTFELGVIAGMKYPGYFLIVSDFIHGRRSKAYQSDPAAVRARARSFHTR